MVSKERADQVAGGVFLIGLGILFFGGLGIGFFPGILFVIGASNIARGMAEGRAWYNVSGGVWMIGLGAAFLFDFSWPLILVLIGLSMLFGISVKDSRRKDDDADYSYLEDEKLKNETKRKNDDYIIYDEDEDAAMPR